MKKNPNGYGCVTKLSGNRSRPWCIKVTIYNEEGRARQVPVGYAATKKEALVILAQYNNSPWSPDRERITLLDLYKRWENAKAKKLSPQLYGSLRAAFKHCSKYYGVKYRSMKAYQMQECVDNCPLSPKTKANIKNIFGHLDRFAYENDIIDRMYSQVITVPAAEESNREPFTEEQISRLWELKDIPWADSVLIYIYTGFRLQELLRMKKDQVDLDGKTFCGGLKTASGKNRYVPIHPRILHMVEKRMEQSGDYFFSNDKGKKISSSSYYRLWENVMKKLDAEKTPHEARHTFETRLDNAGANKKCIDMLMGHKSKDIGNRVYNHKTLDQLRETVQLLK